MESSTIYIVFLGILFLLAITDLIVGVSNDAVNFLNSAIGAKAAGKRTIMAVAAVGIALGAMFSSGMMEVARKGIMNPSMFMFDEIMVIFVAVMLTDILLLDFFNTYGLPTSTTVSIVFELLGASTAMAAYKIYTEKGLWTSLPDYINQQEAIFIISGIFISILVAFVAGMVVQYLARLLFTFDYTQRLRKYGGVFCGIAITVIFDFLLMKGLKGTTLVPAETLQWLNDHTNMINLVGFLFWSLLSHLLIVRFQVNMLRYIVLLGTFALAMAFAGNDLVNFIGVPIAGLLSYNHWVDSGIAPGLLRMDFLSEKVATPAYLLFVAGIIMTVTLIFSRKAKTVTATSLDLGRQGLGTERFKPNMLSRAIVGGSIFMGAAAKWILPAKVSAAMDKRFNELNSPEAIDQDRPSFDLVRASVSLMVSAVLIAFATSLKLPLSTTYVTFMVAMGASLSDRAWNRDSAVFRVAGVINVVVGWLFTAMIAFSAAGIMALVMANTGIWGLIVMVVVAAFFIIRSYIIHRRKASEEIGELDKILTKNEIKLQELKEETSINIISSLELASSLLRDQIFSLKNGSLEKLNKQKKKIKTLQKQQEEVQLSLFHRIEKMEGNGEMALLYVELLNSIQNVQQAFRLMNSRVKEHVSNHHSPLLDKQLNELHLMFQMYQRLNKVWIKMLSSGQDAGSEELEQYALVEHINKILQQEVLSIKSKQANFRNSSMLNSYMLELRDLVRSSSQMVRQFNMLK